MNKTNSMMAACVAAVMMVAGCASHTVRVAPRPAPSVGEVGAQVAKAKAKSSSATLHAHDASVAAVQAKASVAKAQAAATANDTATLKTALAAASLEVTESKEAADAAAADATDATAAADAATGKANQLQGQIDVQTGDLNVARQTVADDQDKITTAQKEKNDAITSKNKLVVRINIYRIGLALAVGWFASKLVPAITGPVKAWTFAGAAGITWLAMWRWL